MTPRNRMTDEPEHPVAGCTRCAAIPADYIVTEWGLKMCVVCGGTVFALEEAIDKILEQEAYIRELEVR